MNILLIEPDLPLAQTYTTALKSDGHQTNHVVNAQGAVHQADSRKPDLVILEIQLVGHNGLEFLYEFRSYPEWQSIPVILHTLVPHSSVQSALETLGGMGASRYLYKPQTSLQKLLLTISEFEPIKL